MVECDLAKVEVAGSNPVSRSSLRFGSRRRLSAVATRRRTGRLGELRLAQARTLAKMFEWVSFGWQANALRFDDGSDLLFRALLLLRLDAAGISLHPVPTGAVAKW